MELAHRRGVGMIFAPHFALLPVLNTLLILLILTLGSVAPLIGNRKDTK